MTPRERVLKTLGRKIPDRVPWQMRFTPGIQEIFRQKTGAGDPAAYFDFDMRDVVPKPTKKKTDFSRYLGDISRLNSTNEWGVGKIRGSIFHFEDFVHPLANIETIEELEKYPWPDVDADYRYEPLKQEIRVLKDKGYAVAGFIPMINGTLFENTWLLRGLENLLSDFLVNGVWKVLKNNANFDRIY